MPRGPMLPVLASVLACLCVAPVAYADPVQPLDIAFAPPQEYEVSAFPFDVATGDVNGDGNLDLGVIGEDTTQLLRGDGTGAFGPAELLAAVPSFSIGFADLNADGLDDIVYSQQRLVVRISTGTGFLPPVRYQGSGPPAFADLNSDGNLDVVTGAGVSVLLGDGTGALEYTRRYSDEASGEVVAQDFDGDGDADVAVTVDNMREVRVYRGDGSGLLSAPVAYPVSGFADGLAATDLDGDSDPDLVVAQGSSSSIAVLRNDGSAGFADQQEFPTGVSNPRDLVAADFDRDGAPDVAVAGGSVSFVRVLAGIGDGRLGPGQQLSGFGIGVGAGDLDNDGDVDLVSATYDDAVQVLLNVSAGGPGTCTITGTAGDDRLQGTSGDDVICGLGGDDTLLGGGGDDILVGGNGADRLSGGAGSDELSGNNGDDTLVGGGGVDRLSGGAGTDACAAAPEDVLRGCP